MHKQLARQLRRFFGSASAVPESLRPFVAAVEDTYRQADDDRAMVEHSMEKVSRELEDRFLKLRDALGQRDEINQTLSLLTATLDSTADGILVTDSHGTIVRFNSKFAELWRLPETILSSRDDDAALEYVRQQLDAPEEFVRKVREVYSQPDVESFDTLQFKDGRTFERYSLPQRIGDTTVGRVWSFRDVTERRHMEAQLRQSQKMEAVGQLAGGVAHDFNNLLTVIQVHAQLLVDDADVDGPLRRDLDEILSATRRAADLTRQLLAFSRKQVLRSVVFDLNSVVTGMEPMIRRLIDESIEIGTVCSTEPVIVSADPGQMELVLMNLVINARDAMPDGGRLVIETANITIAGEAGRSATIRTAPGDYAQLSVTDTGVGIPRDQIARVFEPFFTTKEIGKGTGLGLSTLYGIVKQSGGYVWAESEVGTGTTFTIHLPRAAPETHVPEQPASPSVRPRGCETILVAEDEGAVASLIERILQKQGYTVFTARNGKEALSLAQRFPGRIDMLLTDVIMPEVSGRELAELMRMERPDIRVLFISGYTGQAISSDGDFLADSGFLQKPFTSSELAQVVRAQLDTRDGSPT